MTVRTRAPFRADHVGSLLRPPELLELRTRAVAGEVDAETLRMRENECIDAVIAMQESIGLESITDGEFRRESFHGDFIDQLDGVEFKLFKPAGGPKDGAPAAPFVAVVSAKMELPDGGIEVENFRYTAGKTSRTAKQTIPSPTMTHFRGGRQAIDDSGLS